MRFRTVSFSNTANISKIRLMTKVWKIQIKLPCGFGLKENIASAKMGELTIFKVLN